MAPFLFLLLFLSEAASGQIVVTVHPGDNVTLPCQAAGSSIRAVEWTRPDLEPDTVLLYIDGHLKPDYQHPSFKDRVELVDRDLKDGNVSLILKNVNRHDTGTYTCGVKTGDTDQIRLIRTVRLQVTGSNDGNSSPGGRDLGLAAAGVLVVLLLVSAAVGGVLMYKRRKNKRSGQPADDDDDDDDDDEADGKASPDQIVVTVNPGDDVILPCKAAGSSIRTLKWSRPDLNPDTVLLYRDGYLDTDHQHPSFKDRVELVDRDLKDGVVSLILKKVNRHDTGTYECRVITGDTDPIRTIRTVRLQVTDLTEVTVDPGDDVILSCQAADSSISVVVWTKRDLEPNIILFYRDGHLETDDQHPSFKDRVKLVDRDLKDGDMSLILKNVNIDDAGTYVCRVASGGPFRFIRTVRLQVTEPAVPRMETPLLETETTDSSFSGSCSCCSGWCPDV